MSKRVFWSSVTAAALVGLLAGGLLGWFIRGGWTADWVSAAGAWAGAAGTFLAVAVAMGIAIRDGRIARDEREDRDAQQARNVLVQPILQGGFAFKITNYSNAPVRNVLLEDVRIAWKNETKSAGKPIYRDVPWKMAPTIRGNLRATPFIESGESHTFYVQLDTGSPFLESAAQIGTYEVSTSLTDSGNRRWRNVNGRVALIRKAERLEVSD